MPAKGSSYIDFGSFSKIKIRAFDCQTGLFPQQSERQNDRGIPNGTRLDVREAHIRTRESELSGVLTRRAGARNELIISSGNR